MEFPVDFGNKNIITNVVHGMVESRVLFLSFAQSFQ